jgi:carboxylesterase
MKIGVLIIHGFAGTRAEVETLRKYLEQAGYLTSVPLLKGHESTKAELAGAKHEEWISGTKEELIKFTKSCEKVAVVGFSMGGLIAVNLFKQCSFDGLVLVNTPVYYWNIKVIIKNLISNFKLNFNKYFVASSTKPLHALFEFQSLLSKTKPLFSSVNCNTLVMQEWDDDTVNPRSAKFIYNKLSGKKRLRMLKKGGHVLLMGSEAEKVCKEIEGFIREL